MQRQNKQTNKKNQNDREEWDDLKMLNITIIL